MARTRLVGYARGMSGDVNRFIDAAMSLPDDERAEVAVILADSVGEGLPSEQIDAAWLAEAKRRLASIQSGASKPTSMDDVEAKLRSMIQRARERQAATG